MRKLFNKIAIILLALTFAFFAFACSGGKDGNASSTDNDGNNNNTPSSIKISKLLEDTLANTLNKPGIKVSGTATLKAGGVAHVGGASYEVPLTAELKKTEDDYDFSAVAAIDIPAINKTYSAKKIGNMLYYTDNSQVWEASRTDRKIDVASVIDSVTGVFESEDKVSPQNDVYVLSESEDYGEEFTEAFSSLYSFKDFKVSNVLAPMVGKDGYTGAMLEADVNAMLDSANVGALITNVNATLVNVGIPVTVKDICDSYGLTADMISKKIAPLIENGTVSAPAPGQGLYDYISATPYFTSLTIEELWSFIEFPKEVPEITFEQVSAAIKGSISGTVGQLFDTVAGFADKEVKSRIKAVSQKKLDRVLNLLNLAGAINSDNVKAFAQADNMFSLENLKKLSFTEDCNEISGNMQINADKTLKSVWFDFKTDIKYNSQKLVKAEIILDLSFAYDTVTVTEPQTVLPAFTADEYWVNEFPNSGAEIIIYPGRGVNVLYAECCLILNDDSEGEPINGVEYVSAQNKITFSPAAVAELKACDYGATLYLYYKLGQNEQELSCKLFVPVDAVFVEP